MARKVARIGLVKPGFHLHYMERSSKAIKKALNEIIGRLKNPLSQSDKDKKILEKEGWGLISLLKEARIREEKARKHKSHQTIGSVMRKDQNPSRKANWRPGRGRRAGWLVQGGFMDGHGKSDGWEKDE
jgi:hypothetical protein